MDTMRTTPRPVRTLAALAVGVLLTTSACGGDDSATDPVAADRSDSPTATASPSEPAPSDVPSEEPAAAGAVPVYYVGDSPMGPRLYREFRKVSGEPALGAAEMAASGVGILLISSEIEEVINLSHRGYLMSEGRIFAEETCANLGVDEALNRIFHQQSANETSEKGVPA